MALEISSMGSEKNGQELYIHIFAKTACIRVHELEQGFKYTGSIKNSVEQTIKILNSANRKVFI